MPRQKPAEKKPRPRRPAPAAATPEKRPEKRVLRLYLTGTTPASVRALANLKRICEEHLKGQYALEVIDIYQRPGLLEGEQIIAAPTLIKQLPPPLRRLVGDMSNTAQVLLGLDLRKG
jgi:circadian clock protein KaiB